MEFTSKKMPENNNNTVNTVGSNRKIIYVRQIFELFLDKTQVDHCDIMQTILTLAD